jgi:hypothetical protein
MGDGDGRASLGSRYLRRRHCPPLRACSAGCPRLPPSPGRYGALDCRPVPSVRVAGPQVQDLRRRAPTGGARAYVMIPSPD